MNVVAAITAGCRSVGRAGDEAGVGDVLHPQDAETGARRRGLHLLPGDAVVADRGRRGGAGEVVVHGRVVHDGFGHQMEHLVPGRHVEVDAPPVVDECLLGACAGVVHVLGEGVVVQIDAVLRDGDVSVVRALLSRCAVVDGESGRADHHEQRDGEDGDENRLHASLLSDVKGETCPVSANHWH